MREKIVSGMRQMRNGPEGKKLNDRVKQIMKQKYQDEVYYVQHKARMIEVNARQDKKDKNRQTILEKWKDPEFAALMRQKISDGRKNRKSSSSAMKALWADPVRKAEMLERRKNTRKKKKIEAIDETN